jgi:hypothetical protein
MNQHTLSRKAKLFTIIRPRGQTSGRGRDDAKTRTKTISCIARYMNLGQRLVVRGWPLLQQRAVAAEQSSSGGGCSDVAGGVVVCPGARWLRPQRSAKPDAAGRPGDQRHFSSKWLGDGGGGFSLQMEFMTIVSWCARSIYKAALFTVERLFTRLSQIVVHDLAESESEVRDNVDCRHDFENRQFGDRRQGVWYQ